MQVVIVMKHELRDGTPSDLLTRVRNLQDVTVLDSSNNRVTIAVTPESLSGVHKLLGNYYQVESVVDRLPN